MTLLPDTQALLWWREGSRKLGPRARAAIEQGAFGVLVSVASAWEIAIKAQTGRLELPVHVDRWLPAAIGGSGFDTLNVSLAHAVAVAGLPPHHPDPFDRMLIAQALLERLTIVTSNMAFEAYPVKVLDARQ